MRQAETGGTLSRFIAMRDVARPTNNRKRPQRPDRHPPCDLVADRFLANVGTAIVYARVSDDTGEAWAWLVALIIGGELGSCSSNSHTPSA